MDRFRGFDPESRYVWACSRKKATAKMIRTLAKVGMDFTKPLPAGNYSDEKEYFVLGVPAEIPPARLFCLMSGSSEKAAETLEELQKHGADCSMAIADLSRGCAWLKDSSLEREAFLAIDKALEIGAKPEAGGEANEHPLEIALRAENPRLFRKLMEVGCDPALGHAPLKDLLLMSLAERHRWDLWGAELEGIFRDGVVRLSGRMRPGKRETAGSLLIRAASLSVRFAGETEERCLTLLSAATEQASAKELSSLCKELRKRSEWQESFVQKALALAEASLLEKTGKRKGKKSAGGKDKALWL